ncbi:protein CASC3-like isoform X2 [Pectinophora gossypiella]|uniref:protein CASC3-like isoform X2 n=1 Tax=Pectinophora gossypiella TaxID=13191 RepID=UPI00214E740C|nr:protein CASC3-like isoform X2 [Pectinophora gossypiella]
MTSIARRREHDSGDYSDASQQENDQDTSGNGGVQNESDYDSAASDSERSDRDPDNQETERRVDDDEDRSNPQYIPKRGTFYEHDDRTAASGEESSNTVSETASEKKEGTETPSERRRGPRKSESLNKWSHDKYNENEQMPKSRDELVSIYGYDIRNEDAPPHARRNRRYGRGPNKYTRTWEDEEAYRRQAAAPQPRKPPSAEDFPELDANNRNSKKRPPRTRSKSQPSSTESVEQAGLRRVVSIKGRKPRTKPRADAPVEKETVNITLTNTHYNNSSPSQPQRKVNVAVAQQRPVPTEQGKKKPPAPAQPPPQNNSAPKPTPPQQQTQQQQQQKPQQQQNQTQQQPQESRGGSKRYSSLRQRPLDTYSPTQHAYHEYPGGQAANQHQGSPAPQMPHPQQLMQQMHRTAPVNQQHGPSPPHQQLPQQPLPQQQIPPQQIPQQQIPPQQLPQQQIQQQQLQQQQMSQQQQVRLGMLEQQQMVSHPHHTMHNMPQHSMGQMQPAQGYAPPAMMPAQYMQQGGSGAVFGGAPMYAQPPAPYPHQIYQHHNYVPGAAQAGGVTYYSCAEQEPPAPPARAPRRPTAAIPIVRPAAPSPPHTDRPANSSEKDNIDRIVENMFVRKPWPATHGADSKEKSETRGSQEPASKESSQPNSLTSSSISTDSKPSESIEQSTQQQPTQQQPAQQQTQQPSQQQQEPKEPQNNSEPQKEKESAPVESQETPSEESISTNA